MATTYVTLLALLMALLLTSSASTATTDKIPSRNQDRLVAIEEMQKANYFTFVMLLNMAPKDLILENVTFLMPNDRALATALAPENAVADFLLRHSIPLPLLFDHLLHFPTGSMIPTSKPEFMHKVSNNGGRSFYLSNVRIVRPDVCNAAGSSIRCHGIDGVVVGSSIPENHNTTCSNIVSPGPTAAAAAPPPLLSWASPLPAPQEEEGGANRSPSDAPPPTDHDGSSPQKSGSSRLLHLGGFSSLESITMACLIVVLTVESSLVGGGRKT